MQRQFILVQSTHGGINRDACQFGEQNQYTQPVCEDFLAGLGLPAEPVAADDAA